jgi:hypothetical protein
MLKKIVNGIPSIAMIAGFIYGSYSTWGWIDQAYMDCVTKSNGGYLETVGCTKAAFLPTFIVGLTTGLGLFLLTHFILLPFSGNKKRLEM